MTAPADSDEDASLPKDYWDERLATHPGLVGVGFIGLGKQYNDWLYRVKKAVFLRKVRSQGLDLPRSTVLDVGSGTGFFIERWKELGVRKVVGVDLADTSVANLRRGFPEAEFHQMDIGSDVQGRWDGAFDAVSSFDVLYHIVDDEKYVTALGNIYSFLRPGGLFIWSDNFVHQRTLRAARQVSRSLQEIEEVLAKTGFEIIERRPLFYLMNTPVDSLNPIRRLMWRLIGAAVSRSEIAGLLIGALLYVPERVLTSLARESPTTEIMICRKPGPHPVSNAIAN
jgi:SAM-dependent methyltransferase